MMTKRKSQPKPAPLTADEVSRLTDSELQLMLVRESLRRFGTPIPPPGAALGFGTPVPAEQPKIKASGRKLKVVKVIGPNETHTCPRCGETKNVLKEFGTRVVKGVIRKQSNCYTCRALKRG